jgi:steroid delta-isomerase-like uncharacterized protein
MSLEENKDLVRKLGEAFNKKDLAAIGDLIAPDFVDHDLNIEGWESYKQFITRFFIGFPDVHQTLLDMIAEGNRVVMYFKYIGTHTGEFLGVAPTDKKITLYAITTWRIAEGKIVEKGSQVWDFLDIFTQLGIIEYTEKGKQIFPEQ